MTKFRFDDSFKTKEIEILRIGYPVLSDETSKYIEVPDFVISDIRTIIAEAGLICYFNNNAWSVRHKYQ